MIKSTTEYNILMNPAGQIMILIKGDGTPKLVNPYLLYENGEDATLYFNNNREDGLVLNFINKKVRENLFKSKQVLIVETNEGSVIREYNVPVKKGQQ